MNSMPADYIEDDYEERITVMGGFEVPLNIFLYQELQRYITYVLFNTVFY